MKIKSLLLLCITLLITECTKVGISVNNLSENHNITITGNSISGFMDKDSRIYDMSRIPENGSIIFYSNGGIKSEGDILSYINGEWTGLTNNQWNQDYESASFIAYYPIIRDVNDLYNDDGELIDVVCCKDTISFGETINLSFTHIFTKFTINIEQELNNNIELISINIPQKLANIDLTTGKYSTTADNNNLITLNRNDNCIYEFLIPSISGMNISFDINFNDNTSENVFIKENIFKSGYEYVCNVRKKKQENGIYTTMDFIAFTHLINGETEYEGKKLEDFYTETDGRRIFNLYNDLNFTEEEAAKVSVINELDDIFDGNNHTLSNLTVNKNKNTNIGIFGLISETGYLKNIILNNCSFKLQPGTYRGIGCIFVGQNKGIIDNCHVINGTIDMLKDNTLYSGFTALNSSTGTILNSSISNLQLDGNKGALGIFVYQNNGNIFNCRINNNTIKNATGNNSSTVCAANTKNIYNIFVGIYNPNYYGICYNNDHYNYPNCIIPISYKGKTIGYNFNSSSALKNVVYYENTAEEYERIAELLNNWIDENQSRYPEFTFRRWKSDQSDKVVFE